MPLAHIAYNGSRTFVKGKLSVVAYCGLHDTLFQQEHVPRYPWSYLSASEHNIIFMKWGVDPIQNIWKVGSDVGFNICIRQVAGMKGGDPIGMDYKTAGF